MYLKYGNYTHAVDEAAVVISKKRNVNQYGVVIGGTETWKITGMLHANSVSALTTSIQAFETAYSRSGQDVYLLDNNMNLTAHYIRNSDTVSGVVATAIAYPMSNGAEYTTFRSYEIELTASYDVDSPNGGGGGKNDILEFDQTISTQGTGGPQFVVRTTRYGRPIMQQVARATPVQVQQSGFAVGYSGYPAPPAPIYPKYEHLERRTITTQFPKVATKQGEREFRINWSYSFTVV